MSDTELKKQLDKARKEGVAIFKTDDIEKTRQKLYRILREEKKNQLPMFPPLPVTIKTTKQADEIMIISKKEQALVSVQPSAPDVIEQIQKTKQIKKAPLWIKRWRDEIQQVEEQNPTFVQGNPDCKDGWEYFDTLKNIMDTYMDLDNEDELLEKAIRGAYEDFTANLIAAFYPQYIKPKPITEMTLDKEIEWLRARLGELVNDRSQEAQSEIKKITERQEVLRKRKDEELMKKAVLG